MDPSVYQKLAARTECDQTRSLARLACLTMSRTRDYTSHQLRAVRVNHGVLGLAGEVGELAAAVEKWVYYGQALDAVNIGEEIGDCLWYLAELCNALGLDLGVLMMANIAKLKARYPERYADECAANRDVEAERLAMRMGVPAANRDVAGEIVAESGVCNLGSTEFPATPNREALEAQRKLQESCGHEWVEPGKGQTRCKQCGAYRHLSSGFQPCPTRPFVVQGDAVNATERPLLEPAPCLACQTGRHGECLANVAASDGARCACPSCHPPVRRVVQDGHGWAEPEVLEGDY